MHATNEYNTYCDLPTRVWRVDIQPADIVKAQRIRKFIVSRDPFKAHTYLPRFCPVAFAIKRSGRFKRISVTKCHVATAGEHSNFFYLNSDTRKFVNLWDSGQSVEPCTLKVYETLSDQQVARAKAQGRISPHDE